MNMIVVDDERIILQYETEIIKKAAANGSVTPFTSPDDALTYAKAHRIDVAFLDINMVEMNGLSFAETLKTINPRINIIFCTGYSEYSLHALELYCSGYLMKPLTEEKVKTALDNLRFPDEESDEKPLRVRCFGDFEVYFDGKPVKFKYSRTKELLAFLVDRNGAGQTTKDIMAAMFETDDKASYVRNLRSDLIDTFRQLGIGSVLLQFNNKISLATEKLDCDYYDYLAGNKDLFRGEYMRQYSFAEDTLAELTDGWGF